MVSIYLTTWFLCLVWYTREVLHYTSGLKISIYLVCIRPGRSRGCVFFWVFQKSAQKWALYPHVAINWYVVAARQPKDRFKRMPHPMGKKLNWTLGFWPSFGTLELEKFEKILKKYFSIEKPRSLLWLQGFRGADSQIRTGDLILTKDALYRLSYISALSQSTTMLLYTWFGFLARGNFEKREKSCRTTIHLGQTQKRKER